MWVTWIPSWRSHRNEGWLLQACLLSTPQQLWLTTFLPSTRCLQGKEPVCWLAAARYLDHHSAFTLLLLTTSNQSWAITDTVSFTTVQSITCLPPLASKLDSVWPPSSLPLHSLPLLTQPPPMHFLNSVTVVLLSSFLSGALSNVGSIRAFYAPEP